jgi:hypothetical protein
VLVGTALAFLACNKVSTDEAVPESHATITALQPALPPTTSQPSAPPPISGGTLVISTSGLAFASDPDHDRLYVVDLALRAVTRVVQLPSKSEPGRVAIDEKGHAFVSLRSSGQLATIDVASGALELRPSCVAPRGVTYDPWRDRVIVGCASGGMVTLPPSGGGPTFFAAKETLDVRDVIVDEDRVMATTFRRAEVIAVDPNGAALPASEGAILDNANLAWRATKLDPLKGTNELAIVTQETSPGSVSTGDGAYGNAGGFDGDTCQETVGIVSTRLWFTGSACAFGSGDPSCNDSVLLPSAVLPVDVASNGIEVAVVAAGNSLTKALPQVFTVQADIVRGIGHGDCILTQRGNVLEGQAIAAAFSPRKELVVQTREPYALHIMTDDRLSTLKEIPLAPEALPDTGHAVFHANAGGSIACASCHAEGGDDGHTWDFDEIGPRRTPSLRGTTANTAPYHWDGDMKDLTMLVDHVFVQRMSGPQLDKKQIDALQKYLFALPAPPKLRDDALVPERGRQLFKDRCTMCHSGAELTNNVTTDVGTGGKFQVPSLVGVAWRGPWLHNGCAETLFGRFDPACGGTNHAKTSDLDESSLADLVAYLESL